MRVWARPLIFLGGASAFPLQHARPLSLRRFAQTTSSIGVPNVSWDSETSIFVESPQNARVKAARLLQSANGRKKSGLVLLEGHRLCCDAIEASLGNSAIELPEMVLLSTSAFDAPEGPRLRALLQQLDHYRVVTTSPEVLASVATTDSPQGVCMAMRRPSLPWDHEARLILVLDGLRDPGNLGTLIRSAAATGCGGVLLLPGSVDPWAPKSLRSAMGATLRVPIAQAKSWQHAQDEFLSDRQQPGVNSPGLLPAVSLFAADASAAVAYHEVDWGSGRNALVVGAEAAGLSQPIREAADQGVLNLVSIPLATAPHCLSSSSPPTAATTAASEATATTRGATAVESLNAAIAGTIVLCEAHRQILSNARSA